MMTIEHNLMMTNDKNNILLLQVVCQTFSRIAHLIGLPSASRAHASKVLVVAAFLRIVLMQQDVANL